MRTREVEAVLLNRWPLLVGIWGLVFSLYAMMHAIAPLLPLIIDDTGLSYGEAGFLYSLPIVVMMFVILPLGILSARYTVPTTLGFGMAIAVVADFARVRFGGTAWLFAFTVVFGLGLAICYVNLPRFVKVYFPAQPDKATGIYLGAMTVGVAVSIGLTNPIREALRLDWRGAAGVWGVVGGIALLLWFSISLRGASDRTQESVGTVAGLSRTRGHHDGIAIRVGVMVGILNLLFFATMGWLPTYLVQHQWQIRAASLVTSLIPLVEVASLIAAPVLSSRVGLRRPFIVGGFLVSGAALSALTAFPAYAWFVTPLLGVGFGVPFVLLLVIPTELPDVAANGMGRMAGVIFTIGYAGGVLGPVAVGAIRDLGGPFALGIGMLSAIAIVAAIVCKILPETGRRADIFSSSLQLDGA